MRGARRPHRPEDGGGALSVPRYDVVVVGAGPAGAVAAREAAEGGARTLLLERGSEVGVPVRCGEFLPSVEEVLRICDTEPPLDLFDLPRQVRATEIEGARAYAPSGAVFEVGFQGHSIWRHRLDQHLASRAVKAGAELRMETAFEGREDGALLTSRGTLQAGVVIGADGPHSTVARAWGFPEHALLFPALSLSVEGSFDPVFEAHFGGDAPGGYAWIIPRPRDANVGLGVHPDLRRESLQRNLARFLAARGLETSQSAAGGYVPMSGPLAETQRGNVLLAGDAAGQVLATSGGGIFTAMLGGHWAGRAAARYVQGRGALEEYERTWRGCMGGPLERARRLFQVMAPAFKRPEDLEEIFRLLGPDGLLASLRCQELPLGDLVPRESARPR